MHATPQSVFRAIGKIASTLVVLLGILACLPAAAEEQNPRALEVRKLVRQLNNKQLVKREEAERKLLELGHEILDLLPTVSQNTPAEVKHRLARVRKQLEQAATEAAVQPTQVTIQAKQLGLAEVFASIEKQTGNKLHDRRAAFGGQAEAVALDLDIQAEPFWQAVDKILDQAGLTLDHFSSDQGLAVVPRDEGALDRVGRGVNAGPFRFEAIHVDAERDLRIANGEVLKLRIEVTWEPRLAPIALVQPVGQVHAVDENGKPLPTNENGSDRQIPIQKPSTAIELPLAFQLPPRSVTKIASLKGTLEAVVPGRISTFRFENIAQLDKSQQESGGVTVTVDRVRQNNELWEVRMRVAFEETSGALQSHLGWVHENECYATGAGEKRIEHEGYGTFRSAENEIGIAYLFDFADGAAGKTLVYKTPSAIMRLPVKYELKEIPLP